MKRMACAILMLLAAFAGVTPMKDVTPSVPTSLPAPRSADYPRALVFPEASELDAMKLDTDGWFERLKGYEFQWASNPIRARNVELFNRLRDSGVVVSYYRSTTFKPNEQLGRILDRPSDRIYPRSDGNGWWMNLADPDVVEVVARWVASEVRGQVDLGT